MAEEKKKSSVPMWLMGCAGALVFLGILCAVGGYWAVGQGKEFLAEKLSEVGNAMLENSNLPEDQVRSIEGDIERLRTGILEGEVALENLGNIEQELAELAVLGGIQFYSAFVLPNTQLTEEERVAGRRVLERYARGVEEGLIDPAQDQHSFDLRAEREAEEGDMFDAREVRRDLEDFEQTVEEAGVPDEPYQLELAERFKLLVDSLLE